MTVPWNYALQIREESPVRDLTFAEHPLGDRPFSPEGAPVSCAVVGRRVPSWGMENGSTGELPRSPAGTSGEPERLTLIPYGCTNLRITEFPTV